MDAERIQEILCVDTFLVAHSIFVVDASIIGYDPLASASDRSVATKGSTAGIGEGFNLLETERAL